MAITSPSCAIGGGGGVVLFLESFIVILWTPEECAPLCFSFPFKLGHHSFLSQLEKGGNSISATYIFFFKLTTFFDIEMQKMGSFLVYIIIFFTPLFSFSPLDNNLVT